MQLGRRRGSKEERGKKEEARRGGRRKEARGRGRREESDRQSVSRGGNGVELAVVMKSSHRTHLQHKGLQK